MLYEWAGVTVIYRYMNIFIREPVFDPVDQFVIWTILSNRKLQLLTTTESKDGTPLSSMVIHLKGPPYSRFSSTLNVRWIVFHTWWGAEQRSERHLMQVHVAAKWALGKNSFLSKTVSESQILRTPSEDVHATFFVVCSTSNTQLPDVSILSRIRKPNGIFTCSNLRVRVNEK